MSVILPNGEDLIVRYSASGRRILCQTPEDKELELREALCSFADSITAAPGNVALTGRAFPSLFEIQHELHEFLENYWNEWAYQQQFGKPA